MWNTDDCLTLRNTDSIDLGWGPGICVLKKKISLWFQCIGIIRVLENNHIIIKILECKLWGFSSSSTDFNTLNTRCNIYPGLDRNGMDLTEADYIKKRWQEYTEELYKKDLHNADNHDGVITDLEPDILKCEVKWT